MNEGPKGDRRGGPRGFKSGLMRWSRRFALLLLAGALVAVALYASRAHTVHPLVVRTVPWASRSLSPFEVRIDSVEGDWFRRFAVRGVEVVPLEGDQPIRSARAEEVEIVGDLIGALRTRDLRLVERVSALAPDVTVDLTVDRENDEADEPLVPFDALPAAVVTRGRARVLLDDDVVEIRSLVARTDGGAAPTVRVEGEAETNALLARFEGEATISDSGGLEFLVDVPDGRAQDLHLTLDDVRGEVSRERVAIDSGEALIGANRIVIDSLSIEPREVGPPAIVGLLTFDVPRLDELESTIAAARGLPDDEGEPTSYGSVRGSVALSPGRRALPSGVIDLRGEDVVVAGVRIGAVTAEIDADDDRLVVRELSARDPGRARIDGAGTFTFDSRAFSETRLTVLLDEPAVYAEGLDVLGDVSAVAEVSGTLDDLEGWIRARAGRIERGARSIGDAEFDARIDGRTIDVDRISANTDFGAIEAAGRVDLPVGGAPLDALLESLTLERDEARLALADSVRIVVDGERIRIEDLRLEGSGGQIELDVDTRSDAGVRVVGDVRTLRLRPFLEEILGDSADLGVLNGALTFESEPLRASVDAQLDGVAVAGSETPIQARVEATWLDDRVELKALSAQLQNLDVELAGSAPLTLDGDALGDGPVSFAGSARVDAAALGSGLASAFVPASVARTLSGAAELRLNVSGTWSGLVGRVGAEVKSFDVLDTSGTPVEWLPGTVSGTVAVEAGPDDTRVTVALDGDGLARLEGDAILSRTLDVRATIADPTAWLDAALAGEARLESTDLAWLSDLSPNLRETSGRLVIGGRVEGSLRELAPTGNVRLERGKVRYRGAPIVDELELSAAVTPDRATIESCRFTVGAAPVVVKGGAALDGPTPRVELSVTGDEVLLFRSSDARIRANVDLGVTGPLDGLRVAGDVALVGGRFRSPVEFESILAGGRGAPASVRRGIRLPAFGPDMVALDVRITTADPMRLDGRLTRGRIRADLRLKGSASQPIPSGRLFVDPLEVAVPAGRIEFTTGLVTFPPSQPEIPVLDLVGRTRLAGYDVTVNVEGDYDEAIVDFSSSPPLPPDDLLLLVLSGRTPNTGGSAEVAGQQVALYVAKDLLQGWLSSGGFDDDDRESFLERIEVITGRDVSRAGLLTIEATYKLKDGLVRERDVLYLAGERDAYEDYNFGLRIVLRLR